MEEAQAPQDFNWQVQVGPDLQATTRGVVNGTAATFFVAPSGTTGEINAGCSTDAGATWITIPPNQPFSVSGTNLIQWFVVAGQDNDAKFVIGNIA